MPASTTTLQAQVMSPIIMGLDFSTKEMKAYKDFGPHALQHQTTNDKARIAKIVELSAWS